MKRTIDIAFLVLLALVLEGCSALKAKPAADSGFLGEAGQVAALDQKFPFHRVWSPAPLESELPANFNVRVSPVDTSHLRTALPRSQSKSREGASQQVAQQLADYARVQFQEKLNRPTLHLVSVPNQAPEFRLELALVELTPTDVARNIAGTVLGALVPGGSVLSLGSQGTVAIEGKLVDQRTGKILFAFADRESGKLAPINLNDLRLYSHARVAIQEWAAQCAKILNSRGTQAVGDTLPLTLLPI